MKNDWISYLILGSYAFTSWSSALSFSNFSWPIGY